MPGRTTGGLELLSSLPIVVLLFASTEVSPGAPATFDDLKVGQAVAVEGRPVGARSMLATEIEILKEHVREKLNGRIQDIDSRENGLLILGVRVLAARDTHIEDRERKPIRFSSLQKGWVVKVKGRLGGDGALSAAEIKVSKDQGSDEAELEGKVQAINKAQKTLTVMGVTIRVVLTTKTEFD